MPFCLTINNVDMSAYFKGMEVTPTGDATVGSATIYLDQSAGGLDIRAMMPVNVWQTYNAAGGGISAKGRLFQGLVKIRYTGNVGTTKVWGVECWDNNAILHFTVRDGQAAKAVTIARDTFPNQIAELVQTVQYNGYGAVNTEIDATTGVADLASGATLPLVTYPGGYELGWYIKQLCLTAQAYASTGGVITGSPTIVSGGSGYPVSPTVTIEAPPIGGVQATATAHATAGVVDSVTITNAGQGYPVAPTVTIEGGGLVAAVVTVAVTAIAYPVKPAYYMGVGSTFGATEVFGGPVLWIYDGALTPTPDHSFSDTVAGGRKAIFGEFRRVTDASAPIQQRGQATFGSLGAIVTAQDTTSQSTYPYAYINHGGASNTGYAMLPIVQDSTSVTRQEAQAALEKIIKVRAYPRDTYTFSTPERVLPGETIGLGWALEGIADDTVFRVANVRMNVEPPDVIWSDLTVNTRRLGLFDDGDDLFAPPIEGDRIGPLAPVSFVLNYNVFNGVTGMAELGVTIGPSPSPDAVGYRVLKQVGDQYITVYQGDYLSPMLELTPNTAYHLLAVAIDPNGNQSVPCTDELEGTTAYLIHKEIPNADFEYLDRADLTKPADWTRTVVAGGTVTVATTNQHAGLRCLKLTTAGGGTDSASGECENFLTGGIAAHQRDLVFYAQASNASTTLGYTVTWRNSAGASIGTSTGTVSVGTSDTRFAIPLAPTAGNVQASIKFTNSNTSARSIYVDTVSFAQQIDHDDIADGAITDAKVTSITTATKLPLDIETNPLTFYDAGGNYRGRLNYDSGTDIMTFSAANPTSNTIFRLRGYSAASDIELSSNITLTGGGSLITQDTALSTSATDGFLYIPTCAGTPTGTPTTQTGTVPFVYDTTNKVLYVYIAGNWQAV